MLQLQLLLWNKEMILSGDLLIKKSQTEKRSRKNFRLQQHSKVYLSNTSHSLPSTKLRNFMSEAREILLGSYWMTFGIFEANSLHPALTAREFKTFLYHRRIYKRSFTSYNFFFQNISRKETGKNEITHDSKATLSVHLKLHSEITCYRNVFIENYTWARLDMESLFSCLTP